MSDPAKQERGSRALIEGDTLKLSFNPGVAFAAASTTIACTLPATLTSISYGTLANIQVRPVGDDSRKKPIATLIQASGLFASSSFSTTAIVCGVRSTSSF